MPLASQLLNLFKGNQGNKVQTSVFAPPQTKKNKYEVLIDAYMQSYAKLFKASAKRMQCECNVSAN